MNHLESLIAEFYNWQGYLVKANTKAGKRKLGGWEMELDIVAFNPLTRHLIHLELSIDAHSWGERERRYEKKFAAGKKFLFDEVFTWLDRKPPRAGGGVHRPPEGPGHHRRRKDPVRGRSGLRFPGRGSEDRQDDPRFGPPTVSPPADLQHTHR